MPLSAFLALYLQLHCKYNLPSVFLMKLRSQLQQLSAFSLILLFSIQAGLGLWLHTTCHQQAAKLSTSVSATDAVVHQNEELDFSCNCLTDFLTPFTWPAATIVACVVQQQFATFRSTNHGFPNHTVYSYCPLRGPPACAF